MFLFVYVCVYIYMYKPTNKTRSAQVYTCFQHIYVFFGYKHRYVITRTSTPACDAWNLRGRDTAEELRAGQGSGQWAFGSFGSGISLKP